MHMKKSHTKAFAISLLVSVLAVANAYAQQDVPPPPDGMPPGPPPGVAQPPAAPAFSQQELDQMLAPIALYPDALLSQILMAATYPLEVVEAARWSRANPSLSGDAAVRAVDSMNWDPSVKSLVAFPQVIAMMDQRLDWTERLGDAFLGQQAQVMDSVQGLRQRAASAGNLQSNQQMMVEQNGPSYAIEPANPQEMYVPYYDPTMIYGAWAYPDYPPVYWGPPAYYGYVRPRPGFGFWFGNGISISLGFFFGGFDWGHRHVDVVNTRPFYYRNPAVAAGGAWQHDPAHRRGVPYREAAVRQRFSTGAAAFNPRSEFRGHVATAPAAAAAPAGRQGPGAPAIRGQAQAGRPGQTGHAGPAFSTAQQPRASSAPAPQAAAQRSSAFEGVGRGQEVRAQSERGRVSIQAAAPRPAAVPQPHVAAPAAAARPAPPARPAPAAPQQRGGHDEHRR
jgi:hypothetical protein